MRTLALVCLLSAFACNGTPEETGDTGTEDTGQDTGTEDTGVELATLTQHGYLVQLAWDDTTGQTRSYTVDGAEVPSTIELELLTPDFIFEPESPDVRCILKYDINGLTEATFEGSEGYALTLEFTLDHVKLIDDTCSNRVGTVFAESNFQESASIDVSDWTVRLALGGAIDADLKTALDNDITEERDTANAFGGQIRLPYQDGETEPSIEEVAVWGYTFDDDSFVVTQGTDGARNPLASDAVTSTDALVNGQYEVWAQFNWHFDSSL